MNAQLSAIHNALATGGWKPAGTAQKGHFRSICPACGTRFDGNRTKLAVAEGGRGGVVIKCFAGCGAVEVVAALGFKAEILFPPKLLGGNSGQRWIPASSALAGLADDSMTVAVFAALVATGEGLSEQQRDELAAVRARIESALNLVSRG